MSLPKARRGMEWANGKHDGGSNEAKDDPLSAQTNGRWRWNNAGHEAVFALAICSTLKTVGTAPNWLLVNPPPSAISRRIVARKSETRIGMGPGFPD